MEKNKVIDEAVSDKSSERNVINEAIKIFNNEWNKQIILYGPPGTSKTYSAMIIAAKFLEKKSCINQDGDGKANDNNSDKDTETAVDTDVDENDGGKDMGTTAGTNEDEYKNAQKYLTNTKQLKIVQFHPSYTYEDFVRGICVKPEGDRLKYEVERGILEKFCNDNRGNKCVLIIDEINRAPLASVLGELIYGLEYRDSKISTPYILEKDGKEVPLKIPNNLYIIGTMNTADRSIGSIDYAVRRRFAFIPVKPDGSLIKDTWHTEDIGNKAEKLFDSISVILKERKNWEDPDIDVDDFIIGHTYFLGPKAQNSASTEEKEYLEFRIKYQVMPILEEYVKDGLLKKDAFTELKQEINNLLSSIISE